MLEIIEGVGGLLVFAVIVTWSIEAMAKRLGGKATSLLLIVVLPTAIGLLVAWVNRDQLRWWEFATYGAAGPVCAVALVIAGYLAVSPNGIPDVAGLVCRLVARGFQRAAHLIRPK